MLAVLGLSLVLGLAGCNGGDGGGVERLDVYDYVSDISLSETETAEETTAHREINIQKEFVDPDEPLGSADDLLNLVFAAKRQLSEREEFYFGMASYTFGLVDIDFDGMPELFCIMSNFDDFGNFMYRFYSLKESDFCNNLLEYKTYSEDLEVIKYMTKEDNSEKRLIIYDDRGHAHQWRNAVFSEIVAMDELFHINEIKAISWRGEDYNFNNHTWGGESNGELEEYLKDLVLANSVCEPISYPWRDIKNPLFIDEQKKSDDYILLYEIYDEYLKVIKNN